MNLNFLHKLSPEYRDYKIENIKNGASNKLFFRISKGSNKFICTDFNLDKSEYKNHLVTYRILSDVGISIPKLIEKNDDELIVVSEDFGNLRYDKILKQKSIIKDLLQYATDTLCIMSKEINFNASYDLSQYNIELFKNEISELPEYYFSYNNVLDKNDSLSDEFFDIWIESFNQLNFNFNHFVHKDFNMNNLIFLPSREGHLKCGVIDYQNSFWGESSWDLFSLLEDSRVFFTDQYNTYFMNYFYSHSNQLISFKEFKLKYHLLNCSRQTRLLGRWVKLANELNQLWYLNFISTTKKRLKSSLAILQNNKLTKFYDKYIL